MDATETAPSPSIEAALIRREYLRRRYLSLGTGELVAAVTFAGVLGLYTSSSSSLRPAALPLWLSFLPLEFILIQGGIYWLAARDWGKRSCMPPVLACSFAVLTWVNPLLLLAAAGMLVWQWPAGSAAALAVGLRRLRSDRIRQLLLDSPVLSVEVLGTTRDTVATLTSPA